MARQNLIYEDGFERQVPEDKYTQQKQWVNEYSIQTATSPVREGERSVRFEHRRNDQISSGYRAEFQSDANFQRPAEAWYGYSIYFQNWSTMSVGEHIMQFHPTTNGGSASLAIYTQRNTFHLRLNPEGDETAITLKDGKQIESGKWYDIVLYVKWAATGGRVKMFIDGEVYADYTGPTLTRGSIPYFKVGINRWGNPAPSNDRVFFIDALRIGNAQAEYKDVAPGEEVIPPPPPNQPPVVNAGGDIEITAPLSSIVLGGTASDPDGIISSIQWTKVSGTGGDIINANSLQTSVIGLGVGDYRFRLTVSDNNGVTVSDDVLVKVNPAPIPEPKTVTSVTIRYSDNSTDVIVND